MTTNQWGISRSDVCLADPKDKIAQIIPNPYPFNQDLGEDPTKVQGLLQELKKFKRTASRARGDTGGMYSRQEEALQVCYSAQTGFNWSAYNSTRGVVGLDNSVPESGWLSPLLQCLYLCHPPVFPIRRALARHFCKKEYCVTCEVSFVFSNMMVTAANGSAPVAQIANVLRVMQRIPEFVELGLFAPSTSRDHAVSKIHKAQRMLLEQFHRDIRSAEYKFPHSEPANFENIITSFFGTEFTAARGVIPPRFYWEVPTSASKVDEGLQHLLKQLESFNGESVQIKSLPPIIVLLLNAEHGHLKPPSSLKFTRPPNDEFNYVLCSNVIHLADDVDDPGIFVSHHKLGGADNYILINDYLVSAPQPEDSLEMQIPALTSHSVVVTFYVLDKFRGPRWSEKDSDLKPVSLYETAGQLLLNDFLADPLQRNIEQKFRSPLQSLTDIQMGDIVAIDAEYVVLEWANKRPDEPEWMRRQRRPHMSLARVSCVLSSTNGDERTIIDDYVRTEDAVLDYLTQYSGIHDGDLSVEFSTRSLTSIKSSYLKLRALVDRGVRFVGHGLPQDFRVCNIAVPSSQIIDTLEIFHRPGMRKLSLRFLAFHVLGERVQEDEHDSVEDARTSLRLYRKYEEAVRQGNFEALMDRVMQKGQETNWYVPEERKKTPPRNLDCEGQQQQQLQQLPDVHFRHEELIMADEPTDLPTL
jgi:PAB-dependent poly(A)-specific ribonuclease subunit 2